MGKLVMQALDERDLLAKKIEKAIEKAKFVTYKSANAEKVADSDKKAADFETEATSTFRSIRDTMENYRKLDEAINKSNAVTMVNIDGIGSVSVATAINIRKMIVGNGRVPNYAEKLVTVLRNQVASAQSATNRKNQQVEDKADGMRNTIIGKESKDSTNASATAVVDEFIKNNTYVLVDKIGAAKKADAIEDFYTKLKSDIDTKVKISNATTMLIYDDETAVQAIPAIPVV